MKRFWDKVDKSGDCWLWTAATAGGRSSEYGVFRLRNPRRQVYAHRFSYELAHGSIPEGAHVLHSCDTPRCVNPEHLRLGTAADNAHDKVMRGRAPKPNARLSRADVVVIRQRLEAGDLHRVIAADYGVCRATVSQINRRANWK